MHFRLSIPLILILTLPKELAQNALEKEAMKGFVLHAEERG